MKFSNLTLTICIKKCFVTILGPTLGYLFVSCSLCCSTRIAFLCFCYGERPKDLPLNVFFQTIMLAEDATFFNYMVLLF